MRHIVLTEGHIWLGRVGKRLHLWHAVDAHGQQPIRHWRYRRSLKERGKVIGAERIRADRRRNQNRRASCPNVVQGLWSQQLDSRLVTRMRIEAALHEHKPFSRQTSER
jgi:hypothetical protein